MIEPNIIKLPTRLNIKFQDISKDNVLAKMAQETQTMPPSYEQNKAKIGEIHRTVNLGFKGPVHEGYMDNEHKKRGTDVPGCVERVWSNHDKDVVHKDAPAQTHGNRAN